MPSDDKNFIEKHPFCGAGDYASGEFTPKGQILVRMRNTPMLWLPFFVTCGLTALLLQRFSLWLVLALFALCILLLLYSVVEEAKKSRKLINSRQEARRLIARVLNAQDDERRQVSRDLHDDIGQQLTAVLISLNLLARNSSATKEMQRELGLLGSSVSRVLKKIDSLSQHLHPSLVEYMGLGPALAMLRRETESRNNIKIELSVCELADGISVESARCLFEVAREALGNALRHSGSQWAAIEITCLDGYGQLRVRDSGCGFNTKESKQHNGLGIIRMQESVRALNGAMRIESAPKIGTEVVAAVPLGTDCVPAPDKTSTSSAMHPVAHRIANRRNEFVG